MSAQLYSDANADPYAGAHVIFYKEPIEHPAKSKEAGYPIFEDRDFIEIMYPGNTLNIIRREVTDGDRVKFPRHWALYQQMGKETHIGMAVEEWPLVTRSVAKSLKALGFHTVEMIAQASDQNIMRMGMACGMQPHTFRDKAKAYLESAKGSAIATAQAQEIAELRQQLKDMHDSLARAGVAPQKKRGRPRKVIDGDEPQDSA